MAGGVVVAVVVALVAFYVYVSKKKMREDVELSILIEPPDFPTLALEPYDHLRSSAFLDTGSKMPSWKSLEALFLASDNVLIQAVLSVAKISQMDPLCSSLVIVYEARGAGFALVQRLMLKELHEFKLTKGPAASSSGTATTDANPMPYRGDSPATKVYKVYTRLVGIPYLFEALGQILNDFCALLDSEAAAKTSASHENMESKSTSTLKKSNFTSASMEVDPTKMSSDDNETINRLSLQLICQKIFVKIFRSSSYFPM